MTIERAIELLKAGRYNEVEYLEAKNMAVEALEYQLKHSQFYGSEQADANTAYTNVNMALKEIDFCNMMLNSHSSAEARAEFQKALQILKSMNHTAESIIAVCKKAEKLMSGEK